jgi:hypothetical protein
MDVRAYLDVVKARLASETISFSSEAIERWSKWALAEADRIAPVKTARFLAGIRSGDTK